MADETPAREQDKFVLRLPDGMRDRLKAEAEANGRSMNAEIIARLQVSLSTQHYFDYSLDTLHKFANNMNPGELPREEWQRQFDSFAGFFRRLAGDIEKIAEKVEAHYGENGKDSKK
ncbi:MAG: Arc family DNA-binding protein [Methylorubrum populi]